MSVVSIRNRLERVAVKIPPKMKITTEYLDACIWELGLDPDTVFNNYDPTASLHDRIAGLTGWNDKQVSGFIRWCNGRKNSLRAYR